MRYINSILCILMLVFVGVQYNDPDGPLWMAIYGVPALWTGIVAFRPQWFRLAQTNALLLLSIAAAVAATVYFWPKSSNWWSMDVWYENESAREGMGMMIVTLVLLIVLYTGRKVRHNASR